MANYLTILFSIGALGYAPNAGVLAAVVQDGGSHRLVPWPSWLGAWFVDADVHLFPEDEACALDSRLVMAHFHNHTAWAVRMLDASSTGPSPGLLRGVTDNLGDFDECLGLHWPHATAAPVEAQYCLVTMSTDPFRPPTAAGASAWATVEDVDPYADVGSMMQGLGQHRAVVPLGRLRFGVCLPASCSPGAVSRAAQRHLPTGWSVQVEHSDLCTKRQHVMEGSATRKVLAGGLVVIVTFVLVGTVLDPQGDHDESKMKGLHKLAAFSVRRNWSILSKPIENGMLRSLAGLKTLMCIWVVMFHYSIGQEGFAFGANLFATPADGTPPLLLTWIMDSCNNGMGQFFFISGFLMVRARRKVTLLAPLSRATRFLPHLAVMMVAQSILLPSLGSGPAWRWRMEFERRDCRAAWWRTMLFVNNFGPRGPPTCGIHLWSLAVDVQCFAACTFAMWLWGKWQVRCSKWNQESPKKLRPLLRLIWIKKLSGERCGAIFALLAAVAIRLAMAVYYKWPYVLPVDHAACGHLENAPEVFRSYTPASIHLLSYVCGGVAATLLRPFYRQPERAIISQTAGNVMFAVAVLFMVCRGVLCYEAWRDAVHFGPVQDAVVSTVRQVLSCVIAATIVVVLEPRLAQPNVWQKLLSNQLLVSLHRLTPLVFLVHMMPAMITLLSARGPVGHGIIATVSNGAALVIKSFLLALAIQLTIQGPVSCLWNSCLQPEPKTAQAAQREISSAKFVHKNSPKEIQSTKLTKIH